MSETLNGMFAKVGQKYKVEWRGAEYEVTSEADTVQGYDCAKLVVPYADGGEATFTFMLNGLDSTFSDTKGYDMEYRPLKIWELSEVKIPADLVESPLPTPTTKGALLEVGSVVDPSVVILPEQTVEFEGNYFPTGGIPSAFAVGTDVCITVNGESVVTTVGGDEDEELYAMFKYGCALVYSTIEALWIFSDFNQHYNEDPITISVAGTKKVWAEKYDPYLGYDFVIQSSNENPNAVGTTFIIKKGSCMDALNIVASGRPISIKLFYKGDGYGFYYAQYELIGVFVDTDEYGLKMFMSFHRNADTVALVADAESGTITPAS